MNFFFKIPIFLNFFLLFLPLNIMSTTVTLSQGDLNVTFRDNTSGINGIQSLTHTNESTNLFTHGGLNLEFFFTGDDATYGWDIFAPRNDVMLLTKLNDSTVRLFQEKALNWPVQTEMTVQIVPPHYLDFTLNVTLHGDISSFNKYNYLGVFYAAYMNSTIDKGMYFLGRDTGTGDTSRWIRTQCYTAGQKNLVTYALDNYKMQSDPNNPIKMVDSHTGYEFLFPFYYGKYKSMMYMIMFEEYKYLRYSQGTYPAWDFFYLLPGIKRDSTYTFKGRIVYKPFIGPMDAIAEYEQWSGVNITNIEKTGQAGYFEKESIHVFPNPFNSGTTIRIHSSQESRARSQKGGVKIYNLQGKLAAILTPDPCLLTSGLFWNATHLPK